MGSGSSKSLGRERSDNPPPASTQSDPVTIETGRVAQYELERTASQSRSSGSSPSAGLQTEDSSSDNNNLSAGNNTNATAHHSLSDHANSAFSTLSLESLSSVQVRKIQHCITVLETNLEVSISCEGILPYVEVLTHNTSTEVLSHGGEAKGIFVIDEGALEVLSPDGTTVLNRLLPGDFCGELSTLFRVPCSAAIHCEHRVCLLRLPPSIVLENTQGSLSRDALFQWCVKRSYSDTCNLFAPKALSKATIASCLKNSSVFSNISQAAVKFVAELTTPILYGTGDTLYRSGEDADHMFCILRGAVECSTSTQIISNKSVKYSDEGYCIAEQEFFTGAMLSHQARALGPLLVGPIAMEVLTGMGKQFPEDVCKLQIHFRVDHN